MAGTTGRRYLMMVVVLVGVGVAAATVRKYVYAQEPPEDPGGDTVVTAESQGYSAQPARAAKGRPLAPVRAAKMLEMGVKVEGRQVLVSGKADVYDSEPGVSYVWLLRVYRGSPRELLSETHYLRDVTRLAPGSTTMTPTFLDKIDLPRGSYRVELSHYGAAPDFPFDRVKFGADMKARTFSYVSWGWNFVIPD